MRVRSRSAIAGSRSARPRSSERAAAARSPSSAAAVRARRAVASSRSGARGALARDTRVVASRAEAELLRRQAAVRVLAQGFVTVSGEEPLREFRLGVERTSDPDHVRFLASEDLFDL